MYSKRKCQYALTAVKGNKVHACKQACASKSWCMGMLMLARLRRQARAAGSALHCTVRCHAAMQCATRSTQRVLAGRDTQSAISRLACKQHRCGSQQVWTGCDLDRCEGSGTTKGLCMLSEHVAAWKCSHTVSAPCSPAITLCQLACSERTVCVHVACDQFTISFQT